MYEFILKEGLILKCGFSEDRLEKSGFNHFTFAFTE